MEYKELTVKEKAKLVSQMSSKIGGASIIDRIADVRQMAGVSLCVSIVAFVFAVVALFVK